MKKYLVSYRERLEFPLPDGLPGRQVRENALADILGEIDPRDIDRPRPDRVTARADIESGSIDRQYITVRLLEDYRHDCRNSCRD